ncbi:MAG: hypothetical protein ACP5OG_05620 [Candidatus Nanoarchaeia archaeon]
MKSKNKSKTLRILAYLTLSLIIILFILIIFQFRLYNFVLSPFKKPVQIKVNDECSLIFNQILHQIKDEGACRIKCENECLTHSLSYSNSKFTEKTDSCNICECYCK